MSPKCQVPLRKALLFSVSERGHRDIWETFSSFWNLGKNTHKIFNQQENLFHAVASYPTEIPWNLKITWQSQISMFGHTLVSCLCFANNTFVFSSFTLILLTVLSTSVSRGRLAPLWEHPSSQPLGSWPTSESMFDKRASLSLSKR